MITPSFGLTATERVLPRMALDFTTASLDPRVTFARSGNTATVVNSSGYVVGINADLPRFDYNPITLACKGLLIEESRTNLVLQSQDFATIWFSNSTVTTNTTVSPSNVQDADTLNATVADQVTQQTVTVANDTVTRTFSVFLKQGTAAITTLRLLYQGGTQTSAQISITWSTKVVTNDFSTVGLVFGAENYGNGWYRVYLAFANNGLANTNAVCRIIPAGAPIIGGTTGTVFAWGAQLEAGAFPTSYIPTVASQVTRTADLASMTGTNFSSWYNSSAGTFVASYANIASGAYILLASDAAASNRFYFQFLASQTQFIPVVAYAGGASVYSTSGTGLSTATSAASYNASNIEIATLGSQVGPSFTQPLAATPTGIDRLFFGSYIGIAAFLNGHFKELQYYPQKLTSNELKAFSK